MSEVLNCLCKNCIYPTLKEVQVPNSCLGNISTNCASCVKDCGCYILRCDHFIEKEAEIISASTITTAMKNYDKYVPLKEGRRIQ